MQYLRADTITEVTIGPAVAVGDGFTPVTSLVGSTADEFEIIKHGATTTTTIAGTLAAITGADGYYALDLSATDANTEGRLTLLINDDSLILPIRHEFMVVAANVFDSLFAVAGTDLLQVDLIEIVSGTVPTPNTTGIPDVNVAEWLDTAVTLGSGAPDVNIATIDASAITAASIAADAITAAKIADGAIDAATFAAGAIDAAALATDAVNEIRDAILPKTNTALPNLAILMVDSTDHITPKTGLSLTVTRSIDGGAFGSGTGTAAEVANGIYQYDASAADVNGTIITFRFEGTDADDTFLTIRTGG